MCLGKLSDKPSPKNTKRMLILSIVIQLIVYPFMIYFFLISRYPVGFMESQLSFSGAVLKEHYKVTNIEPYKIGQILDYIYMVGYGMLSFTLALIICRKYNEDSAWRKSGYLIAVMGVIAACCDATENAFILMMLSDPTGFPDIWAIIHSCFALVKFILLFTCIVWAIVAAFTLLFKKKSS